MRTRKRWRGVAGCGKTLAEQGIRGAKMKKRGLMKWHVDGKK